MSICTLYRAHHYDEEVDLKQVAVFDAINPNAIIEYYVMSTFNMFHSGETFKSKCDISMRKIISRFEAYSNIENPNAAEIASFKSFLLAIPGIDEMMDSNGNDIFDEYIYDTFIIIRSDKNVLCNKVVFLTEDFGYSNYEFRGDIIDLLRWAHVSIV